MRRGEVAGEEYLFATRAQLDFLVQTLGDKCIHLSTYDTAYGKWSYLFFDYTDLDITNSSYLLIANADAVKDIKSYYDKKLGEGHVQVVSLYLDQQTRLERMIEREARVQKKVPIKDIDMKEVCRRFLADEEDFTDELLKELSAVEINNYSLRKCAEELQAVMENARREELINIDKKFAEENGFIEPAGNEELEGAFG
jgi:guanylate kinase